MSDAVSAELLPILQGVTTPSLWYMDENSGHLLEQLGPNPNITIVTNRYDIYQHAKAYKFISIFNDFDHNQYPRETFSNIILRISKEKSLVHFLINQGADLLDSDGIFTIAGHKQEGIKTYGDKITRQLNAQGKLKKKGDAYIGHFSDLDRSQKLDDQDYKKLQKISYSRDNQKFFYSKPGIFGWNKVDKGTQLLLGVLDKLYPSVTNKPKTVLDIGCGYGWIELNINQYQFEKVVATDNNAAALLAMEANKKLMNTELIIEASNCADTIQDKFDLVLCNPPFHQGFKHNKNLTEFFLTSTAEHLNPKGLAIFVVNEFIGLENLAKCIFAHQQTAIKKDGFKVLVLTNSKELRL